MSRHVARRDPYALGPDDRRPPDAQPDALEGDEDGGAGEPVEREAPVDGEPARDSVEQP